MLSAVGQSLFASLSTILPATLVFVLGQIVMRFVLEPIQEQARTVGRIAFCLLAYADLSPDKHKIDRLDEASRALRELAAQLRASRRVVPLYPLFDFLRCVISKPVLLESSAALIHWSNALYHGDASVYRERLAVLLKVPGLDLVAPPRPVPPDFESSDDESTDAEPQNIHICTLLARDEPRSLAA